MFKTLPISPSLAFSPSHLQIIIAATTTLEGKDFFAMLCYLHTIRFIPSTLQCSLKCVSDTTFPMGKLSHSCITLLLIFRAGEGALISQSDLSHQPGQAACQELLLLWALPASWIQNVFCNELYQRVPLNKADFSGKSLLSAETDREKAWFMFCSPWRKVSHLNWL